MNILFIGGYFPPDRIQEILVNSKGVIQNAANNLQWSIIKGLSYYYKKIHLITLPYIGSYPFQYKEFYFKSSPKQKNSITNNCIGFINFYGLKFIHRYVMAKKGLKQLSKILNSAYVIVYAVHTPFLKAAVDLKKKYPNVKICLIVPDLPQFMSSSKNFIYRFLKFIDFKIIQSCIKKIESFVLLTDYMAEALAIENKPWVRIEGIFDEVEKNDIVKKEELKTILYTGTLARVYGIMNLLDAFSAIPNPEYRLWICGEGDCQAIIEKKMLLDSRIKYLGQLPHSEILILQKKATVLVNPRTSEGEYTKYSFPSKTMEYMASGTPCIIHNLPGIPEEYLDFCFVIEQENTDGLTSTLIRVCEKKQSELDEFGDKAREFILTKKNPICQIKKIYEMLIA